MDAQAQTKQTIDENQNSKKDTHTHTRAIPAIKGKRKPIALADLPGTKYFSRDSMDTIDSSDTQEPKSINR